MLSSDNGIQNVPSITIGLIEDTLFIYGNSGFHILVITLWNIRMAIQQLGLDGIEVDTWMGAEILHLV